MYVATCCARLLRAVVLAFLFSFSWLRLAGAIGEGKEMENAVKGMARGKARRLLFASLLLVVPGLTQAQQSSIVYYLPAVRQYPGTDACILGEVYGNSPTAVAQFRNASNDAVSTCSLDFVCRDPTDLVAVTDTTYTIRSQCNGSEFTWPIYKIINPKQDPGSCCVGNPINVGYGAKSQEEIDYRGTAAGELKLARFYNSAADAEKANGFGDSWIHGYLRRLAVINNTPGAPVPYEATFARRPNGQVLAFKKISGVWQPDGDVNAQLVEVFNASNQLTGRRLTIGNGDEVENYDLAGRLTSIQDRSGRTQTLAHSDGTGGPNGGFLLDANGNPTTTVIPAGTLIRVTDPFGRVLGFGYDTSSRIAKVTDPDGGIYRYQYGANNNIATVTYPDLHTRQYLYNEAANTVGANLPRALTGIVDENGIRYATFKYDAQGRGVSTEHGSGVDKSVLAYTVDASGNPASTNVTDARGTSRTYTFESVLGVIKVNGLDQPGSSSFQAQTYDGHGNVVSRIDWNSNRTNYTYDLARNLETSRTEGLNVAGGTTPQTRTITTEWHATFRLPTRIAAPLRITTNVYDADGTQCGARGALCSRSIQATTDANGAQGLSATPSGAPRTWTYTYNANGSPLTVKGPRTDVADLTTYTYYANNDADPAKRGNVATITNAAGHLTSITVYNAHGQPLTVIDPNGMTITLAYDLRQRLTSRNSGGEITTYDYDGVGQLTKVTLPDGSFLSYSYDAAHRVTGISDNLGNSIAYTLDVMGNRTQEQVRDPANTLAQTRSRVYNNLNRLFQELGAQNQTTEYAYDNQGNVVSVKDPLNHVTSNQYDALNRLAQVTDPALGVTRYGYNGLDALTQLTDPRSLVTGYMVDGLGNLTQQASPDTGTTVDTYDIAGNRLTQTDAKGQVTRYAYDALNRVTLITFQDQSKQTYAYDQGANAKGRLSSITETNPANQVTSLIQYGYDLKGRVTSDTRTLNGRTYSTAYRYDTSGRLTGMTYPSGRTLSYGFDLLGRVNQISTALPAGAASVVVQSVQYHPFGAVKSYTLGNGQSYARSYDLDGRIATYTLGSKSFGIGYDAASRIGFISDLGTPANSNTYGYDNLDRLTQAVTPSTPFAYSYDAVGNRVTQTIGSASATYTYSATSNKISSVTAGGATVPFSFDANGSTTNDGLNRYIYDSRGRLVQSVGRLGSTTYQVNALGQRVRKTLSGDDRVFVYDTGGG